MCLPLERISQIGSSLTVLMKDQQKHMFEPKNYWLPIQLHSTLKPLIKN